MGGKKFCIPKRRFKEFQNADAWEQRKVGDIAEVVSGGTPDTNNPDYWEGDINWYAPAEISDQIYALESERKITELGLQKSSAKMLPAEKTILFTSRAGIGKMAILGHSACTNQGFQSLVLKDGYVPYFVYSMGKQLKEKAEAVASGSTFLEISGKMLANLDVMMPNKEEQMKIASYFQSLDNLITLHQRKLEKMKSMKAAYLTEMFPQEGEVVPKRRFAGFTDAWEQRKLGEVAKYRNGKAHENDISESGDYIVINSKFVSTNGEVRKYSNMQNEPLYRNEIAFVLSDVPNGRAIARTFLVDKDDKYSLNQRIAGITPLENTNAYFMHILMNRHPYFLRFDDGAKQTNLSVSDVMEFESTYPSYEEQALIGQYFESIDNLITLHQRKLDKLQKIKKAYLNEMFI